MADEVKDGSSKRRDCADAQTFDSWWTPPPVYHRNADARLWLVAPSTGIYSQHEPIPTVADFDGTCWQCGRPMRLTGLGQGEGVIVYCCDPCNVFFSARRMVTPPENRQPVSPPNPYVSHRSVESCGEFLAWVDRQTGAATGLTAELVDRGVRDEAAVRARRRALGLERGPDPCLIGTCPAIFDPRRRG